MKSKSEISANHLPPVRFEFASRVWRSVLSSLLLPLALTAQAEQPRFAKGLVIYKPEQKTPEMFYDGALFLSSSPKSGWNEYEIGQGKPLRIKSEFVIREIEFGLLFEADFTTDRHLEWCKGIQAQLNAAAKVSPKLSQIAKAANDSIQGQINRYEENEVRFRGKWIKRDEYTAVLRANEEDVRKAKEVAMQEQENARQDALAKDQERQEQEEWTRLESLSRDSAIARYGKLLENDESELSKTIESEIAAAEKANDPILSKPTWPADIADRAFHKLYGSADPKEMMSSGNNGTKRTKPDETKSTSAAELRGPGENGNLEAQYSLAVALANGPEKDESASAGWARKAAEQGHAKAQRYLGNLYALGRGVEKNDVEGTRWIAKAADQGDPAAQVLLGGAYRTGRGVARDDREAVKWYRMAANHGYPEAYFSMYEMYLNGDGVPRDFTESLRWLRKSGAYGFRTAQFLLGQLYSSDLGVVNDPVEAHLWFSMVLADSPESDVYRKEIVDLESRMSSAQIAEANRRLKEFNPDVEATKAIAVTGTGNSRPESRGESTIARPPMAQAVESTEVHLPTDMRLASGSVLFDQLSNNPGKGKLTLDNGLTEDAHVKLVKNSLLAASFYVRGGTKFTFDHIPDGAYQVLYCTGFGWDGTKRDFARGRKARRYYAVLQYTTRTRSDADGIVTTTDIVTLTLHKIPHGNTETSDIGLDEFDGY